MQTKIKETIDSFKVVLERFPECTYIGDPILRRQTKQASLSEARALSERLGKLLIEYRKAVGYGRGLAAPQIGQSKAIFVTYVNDVLETFINPKIIEKSSETNFYRELCLSSGILMVDVERPKWIVMEWIDLNGKQHRQRFDGFLARLYQHEEAHLRGVVNVDEAVAGSIEFLSRDPLTEELREN